MKNKNFGKIGDNGAVSFSTELNLKPVRLPRLLMRMAKSVFVICIVLLFILFANGIYVLSIKGGVKVRLRKPSPIADIGEETYNAPNIRRDESSILKEFPINIMVLGLDKEETRCDVIMLFNFEPEMSKLNILSIARDTRVIEDGRYYRINALYSKGGEKLIAKKLTRITRLPVHYYLTMDFKGFRKIIDTLGGVEFNVPFRMRYDDPTQNLHINIKKGWQLLNGKKAEQLVRYRKGNAAGQGYTEGDIGRVKMQQDFVMELLKQKLNIRYISKADELFDILQEYVDTNLGLSDISHYIGSAGRVKSEGINTFTLPGESCVIEGKWYYIYDTNKTDEMIEQYFYE